MAAFTPSVRKGAAFVVAANKLFDVLLRGMHRYAQADTLVSVQHLDLDFVDRQRTEILEESV